MAVVFPSARKISLYKNGDGNFPAKDVVVQGKCSCEETAFSHCSALFAFCRLEVATGLQPHRSVGEAAPPPFGTTILARVAVPAEWGGKHQDGRSWEERAVQTLHLQSAVRRRDNSNVLASLCAHPRLATPNHILRCHFCSEVYPCGVSIQTSLRFQHSFVAAVGCRPPRLQ
jgi:hypothetical protein